MESLASPSPFAGATDVEMVMGLGDGDGIGNSKVGKKVGKGKVVRVEGMMLFSKFLDGTALYESE